MVISTVTIDLIFYIRVKIYLKYLILLNSFLTDKKNYNKYYFSKNNVIQFKDKYYRLQYNYIFKTRH